MNLKNDKCPDGRKEIDFLADETKENEKFYRRDGRHEQCPANAKKIAEGVYDCGGEIFVGDKL